MSDPAQARFGVWRTTRRGARAFTLVEVLIAATLGALVMWGILSTNLHLLRSGVRISNYAEMDAQVRRALEQLGRDARTATGITWNGPSDITFTLPTLAGDTAQVTYAWTAATQAFFVVPGGSSAATSGRKLLVRRLPALAGGSAALTFARFDRDGAAATTDLATKRIQVNFTLNRALANAPAARDAVTATFTLRNKPVQ